MIYQKFIEPLLFKLTIARAHRMALQLLRLAGAMPFGRRILTRRYRLDNQALKRDVFGVRFLNPIGLAAGFDCNGEVINQIEALGFGFVEIGTITPEAQDGNPWPRIFRLPKDKAIINRIGHANQGWENIIRNLKNRSKNMVVGINIGAGATTNPSDVAQDYLTCFRTLYQYADYFSINITSDYAISDIKTHTEENITKILTPLFEFRRGQSDYRPIMLKISPDVNNEVLDMIIKILVDTPLDGIVAVAGSRNRKSLSTSQASLTQIGAGRVSGEPLRERALEVVRYIHTQTKGAYPIIGVGGISCASDVKAMLQAGASLVQMYTGFIYEGPSITKDICISLIEGNSNCVSEENNHNGEL